MTSDTYNNSKGYCAMQTQIKVRGYHLDVYQHVNNARYLEFLEEARWDGLENSESFQWLTAHNIAFVVVNININYRRPAVLGDVLDRDQSGATAEWQKWCIKPGRLRWNQKGRWWPMR